MNILLVEDSKPTRDTLTFLLNKKGHVVYQSATIAAAKSVLGIRAPDAVILDVVLPDGDGLELLAWIRSNRRLMNTLVVVTSGLVDGDGGDRTVALSKPYDFKDIEQALEAV